MTDLGKINYLLGIKVTYEFEKGILTINQSQYIKNMLKKFRMEES